MNFKKLFLATFTSSTIMWVIAGLWHQVIMKHFYQNETTADHGGVGIILISYYILGALMSFAYFKLDAREDSLKRGLFFGFFMGFLWVFPHELAMAGAHGESLSYVFKNGLWHIFEQGLGGLTIAITSMRLQK